MPGEIPYSKPYAPGIPFAKSADDTERPKFYGSRRWKNLRERFLKKHPLCAKCAAHGRTEEAKVVHHLADRIDHPELAYKPENLEGLGKSCPTTHHKTGANRRRGDRR